MPTLEKYDKPIQSTHNNLFKLFILLLILTSTYMSAEERIRIHYNERPPYLMTVTSGLVMGLTADVARNAFQNAGIPHYWMKTPSKRQMKILRENKGKDCLVGWFKNDEREKFAKYTKAIYQNKPTIGLALFSNTDIESGYSIEKVLENKDLVLLKKSGYSYGKYIDSAIEKYKPNSYTVTVENINMLMMLNFDRADYFFTTEEEMQGLIKSAGFSLGDYKTIRFKNMPKGNKRYILCSKKVRNRTIEKLNKWITEPLN